jgi:hypothetical protein
VNCETRADFSLSTVAIFDLIAAYHRHRQVFPLTSWLMVFPDPGLPAMMTHSVFC